MYLKLNLRPVLRKFKVCEGDPLEGKSMKKGVLTELLCSFFESSNNIPAKDVAGHKRKASN